MSAATSTTGNIISNAVATDTYIGVPSEEYNILKNTIIPGSNSLEIIVWLNTSYNDCDNVVFGRDTDKLENLHYIYLSGGSGDNLNPFTC